MALSQLNPQIIGAEMEHGFAGSYARQPDMIVVTRPVGEKEPLPFGMALMYDANGAVVLMQGSGVTADRFAGVAGREMRSALSYTDQNTGAYTTGDAGSVFQRGSINVLCQKGTPKRGGAVYGRIIKNTSLPNAVVGGFEAEADSTSANTVTITAIIPAYGIRKIIMAMASIMPSTQASFTCPTIKLRKLLFNTSSTSNNFDSAAGQYV